MYICPRIFDATTSLHPSSVNDVFTCANLLCRWATLEVSVAKITVHHE